MSSRLRSLCTALLVLDVAYTTTAVFVPAVPGWKMFESAEAFDITVTDREKNRVDPRAYLPKGAQILDKRLLFRVVSFVCMREPARAPFLVIDHETSRVTRFSAPACEPDAPR